MSGSRSRRKGAQAERDLAKRFAEAMPGADCKRGIGQARRGSEVADVEVPYWFVESKHGKRPNPRAAYAQAVEAANENGSGKTPIAVIRDDRKEPFVVIGLDDFLRFVGEWWLRSPHAHEAHQRLNAELWRGSITDEDAERWIDAALAEDAEAKCAAVTVDDERDQGV